MILKYIKNHIVVIILLLIYIVEHQNYFIYLDSRFVDYGDTLHLARQIDYLSEKISEYKFTEILTLPQYYPKQYSLFYSDTLLPQALLITPVRLITNNIFTLFNINVLLNNLLNLIFGYVLVKKISNNSVVRISGTLVLVFNPFFLYHLGHFQLTILWPIFLILLKYFEYTKKPNIFINSNKEILRWSVFLAILFAIQLYSSPYLFVIVSVLYLILISVNIKLTKFFFANVIMALIFILFLIPYLYFSKLASSDAIQHPISEFINHSAEITDYIYPLPKYLISNNPTLYKFWTSNNTIGERGIYPSILVFIIVLIVIMKTNKRIKISSKERLNYLILGLSGIIGFIFSLGPYLQYSNKLTGIKLPYYFMMELPILSAMRAVSRWELLSILSLSLLFVLLVEKVIAEINWNRLKILTKLLLIFISIIFILSFTPSPIVLYKKDWNWSTKAYSMLPAPCNGNLLELPQLSSNSSHVNEEMYNYNTVKKSAVYRKLPFWSTKYHDCNLINGSSSFNQKYTTLMWEKINENMLFSRNILNEYSIDYIKINLLELPNNVKKNIKEYLFKFQFCEQIYIDGYNIIYDCRRQNKNYIKSLTTSELLVNYNVSENKAYQYVNNAFPTELDEYRWTKEKTNILLKHPNDYNGFIISARYPREIGESKQLEIKINDTILFNKTVKPGLIDYCISLNGMVFEDELANVALLTETQKASDEDGRYLGIALSNIGFIKKCSEH